MLITTCEWKKLLYRREFVYLQAKLKDVEEAQNKSLDRIRQLYKKEDARMLSRSFMIVLSCNDIDGPFFQM